MPFFKFKNIKITGVASVVPSTVVKVNDFIPVFGEETVRHFSETTGVKQFRKTGEHQTASDLCYIAAERVIEEKKVLREEIGALVFASLAPDYRRPSTACVLHKRLKLGKDCVAYDIGLGCSAFIYALQVTCAMMQSSNINKALVLTGETMTKVANPEDQSVAMLFGDAGSAVLLEKVNEDSFINGILKTDGNGYKSIIVPAGGFRNRTASEEVYKWPDGNRRSMYDVVMEGQDVFSFTMFEVPKTIKEFLSATESNVTDYDCLAFHQANAFIKKQLIKRLKVDSEKMPLCLDRYGNPSAPAIPLVLCDTFGNTTNLKELNVLMCGFGVGLSWGVGSAMINTKDILPITDSDDIFEEGIIKVPNI